MEPHQELPPSVVERRMNRQPLPWIQHDGGRERAGYRGEAGDCVTRSLAIATNIPYQTAYEFVAAINAAAGKPRSARNGAETKPTKRWFNELFAWTSCKRVGDPATVHMAIGELPENGRYILRISKHFTTMIDGCAYDTFDPSRGGDRMVYGYWSVTYPAGWMSEIAAATDEINRKLSRRG